MLTIAVTGNIGSGKTTVCKVFELLGVPVFYADAHGREILDKSYTQEKIREIFGDTVIENEKTNRKALAGIVFQDKSKLQQLNAIIHPQVHEAFINFKNKNQYYPYCIQEAAIVFEAGFYKQFDYNILVVADEQSLISRAMKRDQMDRKSIMQRLANQMSQEKKKELADFIIYNDNRALIIPEIIKLHQFFGQKTKTQI
jgi:dephospho-CoA kinase